MFQVVGGAFTHHQKCVLVDTQAYGNNRKITAFIGGLDLCDGRYDTPEHRLFHDLDTVFKDDVHQPTFPVSVNISHLLSLLWLFCLFNSDSSSLDQHNCTSKNFNNQLLNYKEKFHLFMHIQKF